MTDIAKLEAELAELVAANEAATSWGAAVGARSERIQDIRSELRRLREPKPGLERLLSNVEWRNTKIAEQQATISRLTAERDGMRKALDGLHSFVAVMVSRGFEASIPETINTPLGMPVKIGQLMRDASAALAASRSTTPTESDALAGGEG